MLTLQREKTIATDMDNVKPDDFGCHYAEGAGGDS